MNIFTEAMSLVARGYTITMSPVYRDNNGFPQSGGYIVSFGTECVYKGECADEAALAAWWHYDKKWDKVK